MTVKQVIFAVAIGSASLAVMLHRVQKLSSSAPAPSAPVVKPVAHHSHAKSNRVALRRKHSTRSTDSRLSTRTLY